MELSISIGLSGNHMYSTGSVIPSNTAPGAPTITGITSGNGQLSVAFTAGTNGGGTISNYEFSTNDGSSWTTRSPSATTSPIVISGLTNGTSYTVRIRAVNEIGSGTQSASSTATPRTTPGAPTITGITSGNGQLSVAFTAGTNGGGTISNYEFSTNDGSSWTTRSPSATTSPIVISGLTNGTSYTVRIRAVNEIGSGTQSASSTATPQPPGMLVPTSVAMSSGAFYGSFSNLLWTNPSPMTGITGFDIEVKRNSVGTYTRAYTNTTRDAPPGGKGIDLYNFLPEPPTGVTYDVRIRSTNGDPDTPTTSAWVTLTEIPNYND